MPMNSRAWLLLMAIGWAATSSAETRFAVLIGANAGWTNDRPLRHAESDAERMQQVLLEVGGFSSERVLVLRDPETAELRAQLRRLSDRLRAAGDDTMVFFYYSGHADERQLHLRGQPFTWEELLGTLRELPANVRIGLLDACRSGSIVSKGATSVASFEVKTEEPVQGLALLTSSGADELSQETRTLQGSVFTHHFVSGLRGAADANHDGKVTLNEVYQYSFSRTEADTAATLVPQRPAFKVELKGQGELVLARFPMTQVGVVLPKGPAQRYVVVDSLQWRLVAEGSSLPEADVLLALRPGDYQLKRVSADQLEVAKLKVEAAPVLVASLQFERQALSAGLVKGRPLTTDPDELRDYRRGEALGLLAQGEASAARAIFDEILKAKPDDLGARRGKARALVRESEAWEKVGEHSNELRSLKEALELEPTLSEDPDFTRWYRRIVELESTEGREKAIEKKVAEEVADNPRLKKRWGVGLEVFGTRGVLVLMGEVLVVDKLLAVSLGFAPFAPGFDASVKYVPFRWKVSPWVQVGGFFNLRKLWEPSGTTQFTVNGQQLGYSDIWSTSAHFDAGIQYFGSLGFCIEGGLGIIVFPHPVSGEVTVIFLPSFTMSWFF
jgi:tetratricopeptide (TPR) repeat protein